MTTNFEKIIQTLWVLELDNFHAYEDTGLIVIPNRSDLNKMVRANYFAENNPYDINRYYEDNLFTYDYEDVYIVAYASFKRTKKINSS